MLAVEVAVLLDLIEEVIVEESQLMGVVLVLSLILVVRHMWERVEV
jgi:hypothetical protein